MIYFEKENSPPPLTKMSNFVFVSIFCFSASLKFCKHSNHSTYDTFQFLYNVCLGNSNTFICKFSRTTISKYGNMTVKKRPSCMSKKSKVDATHTYFCPN